MTLEQIHHRACVESRRELANLAADALGLDRSDRSTPSAVERAAASHAALTAAIYLGWLPTDGGM